MSRLARDAARHVATHGIKLLPLGPRVVAPLGATLIAVKQMRGAEPCYSVVDASEATLIILDDLAQVDALQ